MDPHRTVAEGRNVSHEGTGSHVMARSLITTGWLVFWSTTTMPVIAGEPSGITIRPVRVLVARAVPGIRTRAEDDALHVRGEHGGMLAAHRPATWVVIRPAEPDGLRIGTVRDSGGELRITDVSGGAVTLSVRGKDGWTEGRTYPG
ncbi:MAG: hypothetical protein D6788_02565, partial [Planctomycetota bacterium]